MRARNLLILLISWPVFSEAATLHLSTFISDPVFEGCVCVSHPPEALLQRVGKPQMPFETFRLILPFGERLEDVVCRLAGFDEAAGSYSIEFARGPFPLTDVRLLIERDETIYSSDLSYPQQGFDVVDVQRLAGVDFITINVFPHKYFPASGRLGSFKEMEIEIRSSYDPQTERDQEEKYSQSHASMDRLVKMVANPEMLESYRSPIPSSSARSLVDPTDPHQFLIITAEAYRGLFENYADWKETQGVSSVVYTVENIYDEFTDGDQPARIRDFIIDAYEAWASTEEPLEFVLLGGDDEIIPVRGCWGHNSYYGTDYHIPCDLYYGCLDGDWNANGNQYYGEIDDQPDLYPEVHVGRFPGDNAADFQNMMVKIKRYVNDPWPNIYTALMVGEQLDSNPPRWGGDLCDLICDDPAYLPPYYYVTKMYDRDGTFSTEAVRDHINSNGSALAFHAGHTNYNYLMGMSPYDVDNLYNTRYPFFSSGGCHTLAFDQVTSGNLEAIGEHALFADAAMMEFLGHSRYGFSNWTVFMQKLLEGIFTEGITSIGASLSYSREQLAHLIDNELYRWEYYELILAGDPQIELIYEAAPITGLNASVVGAELMLSWAVVEEAASYWVYGAANEPYLMPGWAPDFQHRLDAVPDGTTSWMSPYPVGNPLSNWTYLIVVVDGSDAEIGRSNQVGEFDFDAEVR